MKHITKNKADLALSKTILDLTSKGYSIFTSFSEHLPFDLIAYKDRKCYRIQVKYSSKGAIAGKTCWSNRKTTITKKYQDDDFDYYAIYLPEKDVVVYPGISFRGKTIRTSIPNIYNHFYWYEDFLDFTDQIIPRNYKNTAMNIVRNAPLSTPRAPRPPRLAARKVNRPPKDELFQLVWEIPSTKLGERFGVSDSAIGKWCKTYGIEKPPPGYWSKVKK